MPGGPYIPGHKQGAPQSFRKFIRYGACMSSHGRVESNGVDIRRQFEGRTAEGGGEQDIGSGLGVGPVYAAHHIRSFQTELGRIDPGGHAQGLQHGAGGTVHKQRPFFFQQASDYTHVITPWSTHDIYSLRIFPKALRKYLSENLYGASLTRFAFGSPPPHGDKACLITNRA